MIRVADLAAIPDDAWPLRGERGLTYSDAVPPGNVVTTTVTYRVVYDLSGFYLGVREPPRVIRVIEETF